MAIVLRDSFPTGGAGAGGTSTVAKPTGAVEGDLLLLYVGTSASAAAVTQPAGFTLVSGAEITGAYAARLYSKLAGASEPASYTVTWTGFGGDSLGMMALYSDASLPLIVGDVQVQTNASGDRLWPSVAPAVAGAAFIAVATLGAAQNSTPDAAMTERWDLGTTTRIYAMTQMLAGAGASGTRTATGTATTSKTISVAIVEEAAAGLSAPTSLAATAISASEIDLTWNDANPVWDNFILERSPAGAGTWVVAATQAANFYTDTGLTPATAYDYRVKTTLGADESAYSTTATATTLSAPGRQALRLFVLAPTVLFRAQVAQASFVYPLAQVAYDTVTVGSYGLLERDLTVLFGTTPGRDDLGRQRIRTEATASTLKFGRSSEGTGDGEVALQDNAYITVLDDRRVWAKVPYDTNTVPPVQYKDHDIPVGTKTTTPPPLANAGIPAAGTVDALTGKLRVRLPHGSNTSYTVAAGATITTYVWTLPAGVTLAAGYALSDAVIEVDASPGFYWVGLAVTDSNGQTHEAWTWILARDPAADVTTEGFAVRSHRRSAAGQTLEVELTQPLPSSSYPDGTLVALIDGDPASSADRTNILFWGWHQLDPAEIRAERTGLLRRTRLTCVDVAGRLAGLPGFSQMVENDAVRDTALYPSITWSHMVDFDLEKYIDYLLRWHSTALEVTDYLPTGTAGIYAIAGALQSDGASLWDQVVGRVRAFTPAKNIGCNKFGQLVIRHNPMVENVADRTATVQAALTAANWSDLRWTHQRPPRVHWLRGSAVQALATLPTGTAGPYQPVFLCIAPGFAPGQGESADIRGNLLADSQQRLNDAMGHEYARLNARESLFDITLVGDQYLHLDPAEMTWVTLTVDAQYAAQRGLSFTAARGLAAEVEYGYTARREGLVRTASLRWEKETVGRPALTIVQPTVPQTGDPYVPPVVTVPPDSGLVGGVGVVALLDDTGNLFRTADFQTASGSGGPTWDKVDLGTGALYTWVVDPFSPGYITGSGAINGWAVDQTAVYRIADIFGTPTATAVHTFAVANVAASHHWRTIQASFGRYFAEGVNPWLLCISYYGSTAGHTGTWATYSVDGGATWAAEVQVSAFYDSGLSAPNPIGVYTSPKTPGLAYTAAFTETAAPAPTDGYVSTDWGATWTRMSAVLVDDPAAPLPRWGVFDNEDDSFALGALGGSASLAAGVSQSGVGGVSVSDLRLMLGLPKTTKRVIVQGAWQQSNARDGAPAQVNFVLGKPATVTMTEDCDATLHSENGSWAGNFTATYTFAGGDWPGNTETFISAPPATTSGAVSFLCYAAGGPTGAAASFVSAVGVSLVVTEIELDDGTIYTPPVAGPGMIQPIHGQAGSVTIPWPSNSDEQVVYYGAMDRLGNRMLTLNRAAGAAQTDISHADATRAYGVNRGPFGVKAHDLNRQFVAAAIVGNDTSASAADDVYAAVVSSDYGDSWTVIDGPTAAAAAHVTEIAFGGNSEQILFLWGKETIKYSDDMGATADSKVGNLAAINGGAPPDLILGICGGPSS